MATGPGSSKTSRAPGDISRGTQETGKVGDQEKAPTPSQKFAERQSFGDPAHKDDGGLEEEE